MKISDATDVNELIDNISIPQMASTGQAVRGKVTSSAQAAAVLTLHECDDDYTTATAARSTPQLSLHQIIDQVCSYSGSNGSQHLGLSNRIDPG